MDVEEPEREDKIRSVKKGFRNVKNALKGDGIEISIGNEHFYFFSH